MHPGDDAHAFIVVVGGLHHVFHFLAAVGSAFIYHLDGNDATVVQTGHHLLGVSINLYYGIASIKQLCSSDPPNFKIIKCFNHNSNKPPSYPPRGKTGTGAWVLVIKFYCFFGKILICVSSPRGGRGLLFLFLSVIGVGAMLTAKVLFDEQRIHGRCRIDSERHKGHLGHLFHHHRIVDGVVGILSP